MKGVSHCGAGGPAASGGFDNWVDSASSGVERSMFAKGEALRTLFMALYLLLVLLAYYILKPVSRAMFLNKFDIDELPYLYIVIAARGRRNGVLLHKTRDPLIVEDGGNNLHFRNDRRAGIDLASPLVPVAVDALRFQRVRQPVQHHTRIAGMAGSGERFYTREAKRLYGLLGVSAVIGAAFGGSFTSVMVHYIGSRNLLLASAGFVLLAYFAFVGVVSQKGVSLAEAKGAEKEESVFVQGVDGIDRPLSTPSGDHGDHRADLYRGRNRRIPVQCDGETGVHNQRELTAFLGSFYGLWLNLITFVLQFFLTAFVVSNFGVGGALQIMPVSIAAASIAHVFIAQRVYRPAPPG